MKKVPFYHPASPHFLNFITLLLYVIFPFKEFFLSESSMGGIYALIDFYILYPFFSLGIILLVKKAYINIHQSPVSEEFANKLILYNLFFIFAIYIFLPLLLFFAGSFLFLTLLICMGPLFLFHILILPIIIRLILFNRTSLILWTIIMVIFLFLLFVSLFLLQKGHLINLPLLNEFFYFEP